MARRHPLAATVVLVLSTLLHAPVLAFPGVFIGRDSRPRVAHTAHVVVLLEGPISVVTVMTDYEGPFEPFAMVLPVAPDVTLARVRAVKREFVARLEQISSPRFHAFYEMDPCDESELEQDWDVKYKATEPGFLAPPFMPPPETNWTVPNEISIPTEPVFKRTESEFTFKVLERPTRVKLAGWAKTQGYTIQPETTQALLQLHGPLLVADVNPERAELTTDAGLQLGAVRFTTREPALTIRSTLGLLDSAGFQDIFIYVLHPTARYEAANYSNLAMPTNLRIEPGAAERLGTVYNALFDVQLARTPAHVITEYAWATTGCGEPCPNAPLTLSEIMTLGGDIVEAELVAEPERHPDPGPEPPEEKRQFEQRLQQKAPSERAAASRQHAADRRELARRRALMARQRYVLTRLHYRYDRKTLPNDIELRPANDALEGGIGVPGGLTGTLDNGTRPARDNHYQVRFVSLFGWDKPYSCPAPARFRWGRRWKSLDSALRKVWLADDLQHKSREARLAELLQTPLPQLGLSQKLGEREPAPAIRERPVEHHGCSVDVHGETAWMPYWAAIALLVRRRRVKSRPSRSRFLNRAPRTPALPQRRT